MLMIVHDNHHRIQGLSPLKESYPQWLSGGVCICRSSMHTQSRDKIRELSATNLSSYRRREASWRFSVLIQFHDAVSAVR